jgi:hypothetical protein
MQINDRIKELRRMPASELVVNEKNWRRHTPWQKEGMKALLENVGYAGALIAYENNGDTILIDGHLRQEVTPDENVPVLVLDVTEQEADLLLASFDPISSMAVSDDASLNKLISSIETDDEELNALLQDIKEQVTAADLPDVLNETDAYYLDNNNEGTQSTIPTTESGEPFKAFMVHMPVEDHDYVMGSLFELGEVWNLDTVAEVLVESVRKSMKESVK